MKWILGLFVLSFFFTACDNELVVTDQWKDIPVVWGLLNKSDTAHYIRVEKAYLDPTTSALDIARIPDSLYYEDAVVQLRRISSGQVFTLEKVNGDIEGYPRDTGTFAEVPNFLYKIRANEINLVIGDEYEFILQRNDHTPTVTANTIILGKPVLRVPNPSQGALLSFRPNNNFNFDWNDMPDAGIFDIHVTFHYSERSPETGNLYVPKSFVWVVQRNILESEHSVNGSEFYNTIKDRIEEDFDAERLFESIDITIWAGGKELYEFIKIIQANFNITSTQDIPTYTNLSEGLGIFSSRNFSTYTDFQLTDQTLDSLRDGSITGNLNFQ